MLIECISMNVWLRVSKSCTLLAIENRYDDLFSPIQSKDKREEQCQSGGLAADLGSLRQSSVLYFEWYALKIDANCVQLNSLRLFLLSYPRDHDSVMITWIGAFHSFILSISLIGSRIEKRGVQRNSWKPDITIHLRHFTLTLLEFYPGASGPRMSNTPKCKLGFSGGWTFLWAYVSVIYDVSPYSHINKTTVVLGRR